MELVPLGQAHASKASKPFLGAVDIRTYLSLPLDAGGCVYFAFPRMCLFRYDIVTLLTCAYQIRFAFAMPNIMYFSRQLGREDTVTVKDFCF